MSKKINILKITNKYSVASQIFPEDLSDIAATGFQMIICNRPDHEDIGQPTAKVIAEECKKLEILFYHIPLLNTPFKNKFIKMQQTLVNECDGPVLAYCRSGQRSTLIWHVGLDDDAKF